MQQRLAPRPGRVGVVEGDTLVGMVQRAGLEEGRVLVDAPPSAHLEDVAQGHGAVREAVHEECLQQALDVVE